MQVVIWLKNAEVQLRQAHIASAHLDATLLLTNVLRKSKTWAVAHGDANITDSQLTALNQQLSRRIQREPIAYILRAKEFYGRTFTVTPQVLIPRPETETLLELLKELPLQPGNILVDVGTGSGCIAISAKLEHPEIVVYGSDFSKPALEVAQQNAQQLHAQVQFYESDLLQAPSTPTPINVVTANLPYVAREWSVSAETAYEPSQALFAEQQGLQLIFTLITQAEKAVASKGYLLLEADPRQHEAITIEALAHHFKVVKREGFIIALQRV